ncbi:hypothetical protein Cylst_6134 [Cylindrospermum stagnale PCC 7417]|uniref:Uncharacterized protein n=1 Tax=Cylindrospermum stagnale PCC 7417 TaxID=56107 RepID=K9X8X9_9NOST|nr:hypothetical protein [Cylindrospermum stagnale]AFZ28102.1 hypothetical protein Cylst_6134 [Cylindrospermum stagnale PCC 7417]
MELIAKYRWQTIWLPVTFFLCLILLEGCKNSSQASSQIFPLLIEPEPLVSNKKCPKVKIWKIALLEWNNPVPLKVVEELQPYPGGSFTNAGAPGPKHKPTRPFLELFASSGGIAGIMSLGNYRQTGVVVRLGENLNLLQLPEAPVSLSTRKDGRMWVNFHGTLVNYDANGKPIRSIKNRGTDMVSADKDAVWLVDFEKTASFVSADGEVKGPYPWDGFNNSSAQGQNLCRINYDKPGNIECLEPNGKKSSIVLFLADKIAGKIIKFTDKILLTRTHNTLSYHDNTKGESQLEIENAGLTTTGEAFINLPVDDNWSEVCISDGTSRWVPIKYDSRHLKKPKKLVLPKMTVVAVDGDRTLTFAYDSAKWWKGNKIEKSLILDENGYRQDVFTNEWLLNPREVKVLNPDDGTVVISVTGPKGIALIGLQLNPS